MKTHWKKQFNYDYLGSYSINDGQDMTLTIKSTKKEMVANTGGKKEECFVCYFQENPKPMILNRTNCKTIESLYSPYIEDWPGKKITLYVEKGVKAFGNEVDALRVRAVYPDQKKPELLPNTEQWSKAVAFLKGGGKIEQITNKYNLSDANQEQLLNESI
jgi:hypothetical protein